MSAQAENTYGRKEYELSIPKNIKIREVDELEGDNLNGK